MFTYRASVSIVPPVLKPGTSASGTVTFSDVQGGTVTKAYATHPLLGQVELARKSATTYALEYTIPLIAPPGAYTAYVYGVSETGQAGPKVAVPLTIAR